MNFNKGWLPPVEPSADMRASAKDIWAMYVAYIEAGFTSEQALTLTREVMKAIILRSNPDA